MGFIIFMNSAVWDYKIARKLLFRIGLKNKHNYMHYPDLDKIIIKITDYLRSHEPEEYVAAREYYQRLPDGSRLTDKQLEASNPADFWQWYVIEWRLPDNSSWGELLADKIKISDKERKNLLELYKSRYSVYEVNAVDPSTGWLYLKDCFDKKFVIEVHDKSSSQLVKVGDKIDAMTIYWNGEYNLFGVGNIVGIKGKKWIKMLTDPNTGKVIPCLRCIWALK